MQVVSLVIDALVILADVGLIIAIIRRWKR